MWIDGGYIFALSFDWKRSPIALGMGDQPLSIHVTPEFAPPAPGQYLAKIVARLEYEVPMVINPQGATVGFWPQPFATRIFQFDAVPEPNPRFLLIKLIRPRFLRNSADPLFQIPIIDLKIDYQTQ